MNTKILSCLLMMAPLSMVTAKETQGPEHAYTEIHADELKRWYTQGKRMIVVDARTKPYFDACMLPGARWVPCDSSEATIRKAIPSRNATVVVYCSNLKCPASARLAEKLVAMGYRNVYKYPEGLQDWIVKGNQIIRI